MGKKTEVNIQDKTVGFASNVVIKKVKNGATLNKYKIKNNVTLQFLTGLARFTRGDFRQDPALSNNYLPFYLGIGKEKLQGGEVTVNRNSLKDEYNLTYRFDASPNTIAIDGNIIKLFISSFIPSQSIVNQSILEFGLFSTRIFGSNTLLARVEVSEPIVLDIGEALQIDWQFLFGNVEDLD